MVSAPKVLLVVLTVVTLWCSALLYLHVNVAVEPKVHVFHLGLSWNMGRLPTMAMCFRQEEGEEEEDYYCCYYYYYIYYYYYYYYYYYVIIVITSYYNIVIIIITIIIVIFLIVITSIIIIIIIIILLLLMWRWWWWWWWWWWGFTSEFRLPQWGLSKNVGCRWPASQFLNVHLHTYIYIYIYSTKHICGKKIQLIFLSKEFLYSAWTVSYVNPIRRNHGIGTRNLQ